MSGFLSRRLDPDLHGSSGFTTRGRLIALLSGMALMSMAFYLAFTGYYNGRFLPGVMVGGRNLSGMTRPQAASILREDVASYRLHIDIAGTPRVVLPSKLGASYDVGATIDAAYAEGRGGDYVLPNVPKPKLATISFAYKIDRTQLDAYAKSIADQLGVAPQNATILVVAGQPTVLPAKDGWGVNDMALAKVIVDSISVNSDQPITVKPHAVPAQVQASQVGPAIDQTKLILSTPLTLTYASKKFIPTPSVIGGWLAYDISANGSGLTPRTDSARLKDYVNQIANQIDVAPVNQQVTIENGVSQVKQVGVNGLAVDRDGAVNAISQALAAQTPLTYELVTNPVPFKTETTNHVSLDYGRYIEINLSNQHLWVYQDHQIIYDSPVTSGATGANLGTVTGLFSIYYKTTNTHLVGYQYGYNYDVAVKYWMPFYEGYGLHDASWRNGKFGGPDYYYGGSHGCVNLPDATAEFIYNWAEVGTPVWVHN